MTIGKRYKFQGSLVAVQTALGAAKYITAVTKANPAVLTSPAHGLAIGQTVYVNVGDGMPEFAAAEYVVASVPSPNSFTLVGVDSTNFSTFAVDSPNTNLVQLVTFTNFCELTGYNQQDGQADQMDATTVCSTAKEFEVGLRDTGTLALDFNAAPTTSTVQAAIRAAQRAGTPIAVMVVFPKTGGTLIAFGQVLSTTTSGSNGALWKGTANLKLSGDVVVLNAAGAAV